MRGFNQIERQLKNKIDNLIKQRQTEKTVNAKILGYLNRKKDELNDLNDDWEKKKLEETKQLVIFIYFFTNFFLINCNRMIA